jgi:hypothetical protein
MRKRNYLNELVIHEIPVEPTEEQQDTVVRRILTKRRAGEFSQVAAYEMIEMLGLEDALRRVRAADTFRQTEDGVQAA